MRYMLPANSTLIVRGPASFQLLEGETWILGAPLEVGRKLIVERDRQLPIEAASETNLEISLGKAGEIYEFAASTIPPSWVTAADALVQMAQGKVMVIGATDVGKSTFCTYLANRMLGNSLEIRVVDGDLGQPDIGPPTTIGSCVPTDYLSSLVDLRPDALIFVGHTSPRLVERKLISGIQRLSTKSPDSLTVINTDGWVHDPEAISYKSRLMAAAEPDLLVGLASGAELQPIFSNSKVPTLAIATAKEVLERSRSDRRAIRSSSYRRHLEGARTRSISLRDVDILTPIGFPPIHNFAGSELNGLIVGLLNDAGYMLQLGILMGVENDGLRIYSRSLEGVRKIDVGYVRLSIEGTELDYFEPRTLQ